MVLLVSATITPLTRTDAASPAAAPVPERAAILRAAAGIGLYAGVFGMTFGALAATSGLSVIQAVVLSAVMFTGASQFALVGILATAGAPIAGLSTALLLGLRNAFYGVPTARILGPRGWRRLWTAHFVIDESAAMAVAQSNPRAGRYAFWATGVTLCALWNLGTLAGALIGSGIDTSALGLDAAAPAIFLALLWPQLSGDRARAVAVAAGLVALGLIPLVPSGVPIIAAAAVAAGAGLLAGRPVDETEHR